MNSSRRESSSSKVTAALGKSTDSKRDKTTTRIGQLKMIQLARTRECLVCAEYEREHMLPWATLADDKDAFEERLAQMVAMQQASARPGASRGGGGGPPGRGAERSVAFDAPIDSTSIAKKPQPGCTTKLLARLSGTRLPHENRMGDPQFIMSQQPRPQNRPKTKLYDKDEQTQRDFDALYKLANAKCRPTSCAVPCRRSSTEE